MKALLAGAALAAALCAPAAAEIVKAEAGGFEVRHSVVVNAPAGRVWAAMVHPDRWWSPDHTYSHQARSLSLDARAGGCFCEVLPGKGSVEHMHVVYAEKDKALRLSGAMGPLQTTGGTGHMTWTLTEKDGKTTVAWTYVFGGYDKGGMAKWAGPVDGVLKEQIGRLKSVVETGKPG